MKIELFNNAANALLATCLAMAAVGCASTTRTTSYDDRATMEPSFGEAETSASGHTTMHSKGHGVDLGYSVADVPSLTQKEIDTILQQGVEAAKTEPSLVRVDENGAQRTSRMHIFVVNRKGRVVGRESMPDAWVGSVDIARAKAFTAVAFSSDENALTSRTIGVLSQPGQPLWHIGNSNQKPGLIEFPGGVPLYKDGRLVGAVGVSGDGVEQDENVAEAASEGFTSPETIRIDTITDGDIPYTQ